MIIFFISTMFLFAQSDSSEVPANTNYFKDLNLKLDLNTKQILPKNPESKYPGFKRKVSSATIDSIQAVSKNYIPTTPSLNDTIIMETTKGTIKLKYFPNIAEKHCYNFKKLANSGFYDMTLFHRVIYNFMIQGGDILSRDSNRGNDGEGGPGWTVDGEFSDLKHKRGTLSMARGRSENSAGSQFFICHKETPWLDGKYTIFGEVIENIHVIDRIAETPTDYTSAKLGCYDKIPENEKDKTYWINIIDPKTRGELFCKLPVGKNKSNYTQELMNDLQSDNPSAPVIIKRIRVIDGVNQN